MIRIISDTSTLYSVGEGKEKGIFVSPLAVTINDRTYEELEDISTEEFVDIINQGHIPLSSQPAIGKVVDLYNLFPEDEILNITMADGLSGTYNSAVLAKSLVDHPDSITVLNSKTLCGPHRALVDTANMMAQSGSSMADILERLNKMIASSRSFLIPKDYDYLERGGRLNHLTALLGKTIHLVPVLQLSEDGTHLTRFAIKRHYSKAIREIIDRLKKDNLESGHQLYVSHSLEPQLAKEAYDLLKEAFPDTEIIIYKLSPAFTTQGGPGCIAIQSICME